MVDPKIHSLMKEAFNMKIYGNKSDDYIANRLNDNGYERKYKNDKKKVTYMNPKRFSDIWTDEFYYGIQEILEEYLVIRETRIHTTSH